MRKLLIFFCLMIISATQVFAAKIPNDIKDYIKELKNMKGTIEEQILKLQDKKRHLADDIIRENSSMLSNLTKEEILELFK